MIASMICTKLSSLAGLLPGGMSTALLYSPTIMTPGRFTED
jgi:hypothetical protein